MLDIIFNIFIITGFLSLVYGIILYIEIYFDKD